MFVPLGTCILSRTNGVMRPPIGGASMCLLTHVNLFFLSFMLPIPYCVLLQERVFCKAASENEKYRNKMDGYVGVEFSKTVVLGHTTIAKVFKSAAKRMGLPNWESFGAHCLRRFHATTLVNTSGVSLQQAMSSMRHSRFVLFFILFYKLTKILTNPCLLF